MVAISLDEKSTWVNNIYENSRYMRFDISYDGVIKQFTVSHKVGKKFRKSRFKTPDEAIRKINTYIKQVQ